MTVSDGLSTYRPGAETVQTVIVTNRGTEAVSNARVVAPLPTGVESASWVAEYGAGGSGPTSGVSGLGDALVATIELPAGQAAVFSVTYQSPVTATGSIAFAVSVSPPLGVSDSSLADNSAIDTNYRPLVVAGSDIDFRSAPLVSVIDPVSGGLVSQFAAYPPGLRGGVRTVLGDVDGDGAAEVITGPGPGFVGEVRVFEIDGTELQAYRLRPFGDSYALGLQVAFGDFDGDGFGDLAAGQSRGGGVAIHAGRSGSAGWVAAAMQAFSPYGDGHINGVSLAAADVGSFSAGVTQDTAADGRAELIVGTGAGGSQPVRLYDLSGTPAVIREIGLDPAVGYGGVTVSAGQFDDDGIADIFVSGGRGRGGFTDVYAGGGESAPTGRLERFGLAAGGVAGNAPAAATGVDIDGDGRIDQIFSLFGQGSTGGTAVLDRAGNQTATVGVLRGPLSRAAATPIPFDATLVTTASGLQYRDLAVGPGAVAATGQNVVVHYVGRRLNGEVFDQSYKRGRTFDFTLGAGQVIAGWDEGVAGMRVGGRRQLIIPAALGYGDNPSGGIIQPGDTLVFDVELVSASNPVLARP